MKRNLLKLWIPLLVCVVCCTNSFGQDKNGQALQATDTVSEVYQQVDEIPSAPYNMNEYLRKTLKYPKKARKAEVQGRLIVQFIVNADGSISNAKVLRGIGSGCDEEAVRVIMSMPRWNPGKLNGKPVRVYFNQPMVFKLD